MDKGEMLKEEMLYEDALDLIEKAMAGKSVNQNSLAAAQQYLQMVPMSISMRRHDRFVAERAKKEEWELDEE